MNTELEVTIKKFRSARKGQRIQALENQKIRETLTAQEVGTPRALEILQTRIAEIDRTIEAIRKS